MKPDKKHPGLDALLNDAFGAGGRKADFDRWRQRHPEAVDAIARRAAGEPPTRRRIMRHVSIQWATAAAIAGLVLTGIYFVGGSLDGTARVYAAMMEALEDVRTVHVAGWTRRPSGAHSSVLDRPLEPSRYPVEVWEWVTPDGGYRLYDRQGPITVWDDGDRRYEHQAHNEVLYIGRALHQKPLARQYQCLAEDLDSFRKRGARITDLGLRDLDGRQVRGYRVEYDLKRKEAWIDVETHLLVRNEAYVCRDGRWEQSVDRTITYDQPVPDDIRDYSPARAETVRYDNDIDPRFEAWHARLKAIGLYYRRHPMPKGMALLARDVNEPIGEAYAPGRIPEVTDRTGYWVLPIQETLADFLRTRIRPYGSLRMPEDVQAIEMNHDLITCNADTERARADFVLRELGLEGVEVRRERRVWVARRDGRDLPPAEQVKAPVPNPKHLPLGPGMASGSGSFSIEEIFDGFAFYQDYDLEASGIAIEDRTGLADRAVSSELPFWGGPESVEIFKTWCRERFGVTFTEETRPMTVYEVRRR